MFDVQISFKVAFKKLLVSANEFVENLSQIMYSYVVIVKIVIILL